MDSKTNSKTKRKVAWKSLPIQVIHNHGPAELLVNEQQEPTVVPPRPKSPQSPKEEQPVPEQMPSQEPKVVPPRPKSQQPPKEEQPIPEQMPSQEPKVVPLRPKSQQSPKEEQPAPALMPSQEPKVVPPRPKSPQSPKEEQPAPEQMPSQEPKVVPPRILQPSPWNHPQSSEYPHPSSWNHPQSSEYPHPSSWNHLQSSEYPHPSSWNPQLPPYQHSLSWYQQQLLECQEQLAWYQQQSVLPPQPPPPQRAPQSVLPPPPPQPVRAQQSVLPPPPPPPLRAKQSVLPLPMQSKAPLPMQSAKMLSKDQPPTQPPTQPPKMPSKAPAPTQPAKMPSKAQPPMQPNEVPLQSEVLFTLSETENKPICSNKNNYCQYELYHHLSWEELKEFVEKYLSPLCNNKQKLLHQSKIVNSKLVESWEDLCKKESRVEEFCLVKSRKQRKHRNLCVNKKIDETEIIKFIKLWFDKWKVITTNLAELKKLQIAKDKKTAKKQCPKNKKCRTGRRKYKSLIKSNLSVSRDLTRRQIVELLYYKKQLVASSVVKEQKNNNNEIPSRIKEKIALSQISKIPLHNRYTFYSDSEIDSDSDTDSDSDLDLQYDNFGNTVE